MAEELNNEIEQIVSSFRNNLQYEAKDEDLLSAINAAMQESQGLKDTIDKIGKQNKQIWKQATSKDFTYWHPKRSRITSNRIFTDVETAIPILTSEPPEPTILGQIDTTQRDMLQKGLKYAYEVKYKLQQKLQQVIRHWFLFRLGVLKYRWDKDKGFITEAVLAKKIGLDKRATSRENCEYVWELMEDTLEVLQAKFPAKTELLKEYAQGQHNKTKLQYIEFWGGNGEWVCWRIKNTILDKSKNPNFNYENKENNLFEKPQFPYLFLNVFNIGDETGIYDETSLIEEAVPLQEGVNQLEQQILDLNEGQKRVWVAAGEAISEKKAQDLVDKTGDLMVYLDRKAAPNSVTQVQSGKPDASLFQHLAHLLNEIDNVMGIHSTTRGERSQQKTKFEAQLLTGSDYGRMDMTVRNVEQLIEDWFNAYLHMIKVYALDGETLYGEDGEQIELRGEIIPSNIKIMIKKGSTLPTDEGRKRADALQLAQVGMIDPATLFEEMNYPNVEQKTADLYQWLQQTGKIAPQVQTPLQGQPGAPQEQGGGDAQKLQQIQRLKELLGRAKQIPEGGEDMARQLQAAAQSLE